FRRSRRRWTTTAVTSAALSNIAAPTMRAVVLKPAGARLLDGAGLAHHLANLGEMLLFRGDLRAGVFLEHDALVDHLRQELAVFRETFLFVRERFGKDFVHVVLVSFQQRAD